jgi:DNA-binding CsgD family transcriptional regulator
MVRNYMSNIFTKLGVAHRTVPRRTVRGPGMPA